MAHPKAFPKLNWSSREVRKRGHSSREQEVSFRYQQTLLPSTNISRVHFTPVVNIRGRFPSQTQHQLPNDCDFPKLPLLCRGETSELREQPALKFPGSRTTEAWCFRPSVQLFHVRALPPKGRGGGGAR